MLIFGVFLFASNTSSELLKILNLLTFIETKGLMSIESKLNFFVVFLFVSVFAKPFNLNTLMSGFLIINLLISIILL